VTLPRDLGDGLVLRQGRVTDADALAAFNADVLRSQDSAEPNDGLGGWTRDLMTGRHPRFRPEHDGLIVEDAQGRIVSAGMLITQTLSFAGTVIDAGQPELIGTSPAYRGRGLVRTLFETFHRWSAERGQVMQFIAGIPWFYRQFGYEMAIQRGGGPVIGVDLLPALPAGAEFRMRPFAAADAVFATRLDRDAAQRYLVSVPRDEALWRYEVEGHSEASTLRQVWRIVERPDGQAVAVVSHAPELDGSVLPVTTFEVAPNVPWRPVWIAVVHALREEFAKRSGTASLTAFGFWWLGRQHPLYHVARLTDFRRPGSVYTRVPDLARFLTVVAPVLERRLAASPMAGWSGELRLGFYRDGGVALSVRAGAFERAWPWRASLETIGQEMGRPSQDRGRADALVPGLTFQQLLFGSRTLEELEFAFPDCIVRTGEARALLSALFPRQPSDVWPVL
jgi:hypothetical protein